MIALLIPETDELVDGNYLRFGNELLCRGIDVCLCPVDSLALTDSRVTALGRLLDGPAHVGEPLAAVNTYHLDECDTIWVFSLGQRQSFLDKYQLLYILASRVRLINSLDAIMHLKSKYFVTSVPDLIRHPETHAATDPDLLLSIIERSDKPWVAKPPAGSLGRDVFLLRPGESNNRVILEHLCGRDRDQYTLVQEYLGDIASGEKRVLIAGGKVVGQYRRTATDDFRTNLLQGAKSHACSLTADEARYCEEIGSLLVSMGAEFVGLDMVYPWVIEFNVINPGGLLTIHGLTGIDLTSAIIDRLKLP